MAVLSIDHRVRGGETNPPVLRNADAIQVEMTTGSLSEIERLMSRKFFRRQSRRTLSHAVRPLGPQSSAQPRPISRPLAALVLAVICCGCGTSSEQEAATAEMVFVDIKSGEVMLLEPTSEVPVTNPNTGQRTMMPALHCEQCQRWYPVPPAEQMNRSQGAGLCPKHRTPLVADGPRP